MQHETLSRGFEIQMAKDMGVELLFLTGVTSNVGACVRVGQSSFSTLKRVGRTVLHNCVLRHVFAA